MIITVKKGKIIYTVNSETDIILNYFSIDNPSKVNTLEEPTTFEAMFGYKAANNKQPNKTTNNKHFNKAKFNKNGPSSFKHQSKPFNKNNKRNNKNFKPKGRPFYKVVYNNLKCYDADHYLAFLSKCAESGATVENGKVIASFSGLIKQDELNLYGSNIKLNPDSFLYIKIKHGDKLTTAQNPLLPEFTPLIINKIKSVVQYVVIPIKDNMLEELAKNGINLNIVAPNILKKEEYLNYLKSQKGNSQLVHTMEKYFDNFVSKMYDLAKDFQNVKLFEIEKFDTDVFSEIRKDLI